MFWSICTFVVACVAITMLFVSLIALYTFVRELLKDVKHQSNACVDFVRELSKISNDILNNRR